MENKKVQEETVTDWQENQGGIEAELSKLRSRIDTADKEILALLNERAKVVQEIGKVKDHFESEIYIPSREKAIFSRLDELNQGPLPSHSIRSIFREVISACRALETEMSIAVLGPEGSYHHAVAQAHFGRSCRYVPVNTISAIFDEVEHKRVHFGVAAIENSIEGSVGETLDRIAHSSVKVIGESYLPISHNLISQSELSKIKKVYAHPQALGQCRKWLETNLPKIELVGTTSNSLGVKFCMNEPESAAIAGDLAAELMDVPIQMRAIEDYAGNTTRFFVIGNSELPPSGDDKTSMVVFIRDNVGALYLMLEPFKKHGVNITNIVSRPVKQEAWQYMFFIELQGHRQDEPVAAALSDIERNSLHVKILGSYPRTKAPSR